MYSQQSIGTQVIGIVTAGIITKAIASGLGKHKSCLPREAYKYADEFIVIGEGFSIIGIGVVKISVCLTLLRVVELARRRTAQFLWCLLIFVGITHSGLGMMYFLRCRPLTAVSDPQSRGSCLPRHTIYLISYLIFAIDAATDLICATIPILLVQRLQMDMSTKLALCGLMSLGVFTAGCAVAKALSVQNVTVDDYTWGRNIVTIWAIVEQLLGIIITSIPMLRPLFSSSYKSFHNWLRIRFSTQIYSSWGKNHSGSGSLVRSQPKQQIDGLDLALRDVEKNPIPPGASHGQSQADRNYRADPIHSIVTDEEYATENIPDDFEENMAVTARHL